MQAMTETLRLHYCAQARSFRVLWLLHHSFFDKSLRDPAIPRCKARR